MRVNLIAVEKREITYPCIMRSINGRWLVWFVAPRCGVYLTGTNKGQRQENFIEATDVNMWEQLPIGSEIILANEVV